jgi:hypothetical protein
MLFDAKELSDEEIRQNPEALFFPYQMKLQSKSGFMLTLEEKQLIQELRNWSNNIFSPKFVYPDTMFDSCAIVPKQSRDCDLHCKILEIKNDNDLFYEICVIDDTGCRLFMKISKNNMKQWEIKENDIVRIRSIQPVKDSSGYIELTKMSNFLKFPQNSFVYNQLNAKLKDDQKITRMMATPTDEFVLENAITVSRVSERYKDLAFCTLHQIFHDESHEFFAKYDNYYDFRGEPTQMRFKRLKFRVMRIGKIFYH